VWALIAASLSRSSDIGGFLFFLGCGFVFSKRFALKGEISVKHAKIVDGHFPV
jgi:hypothetical protein